MSINRAQLALIHIAAADRGLTDSAYRSALAQIGGVTTANDLDRDGFDAMMGYFQWLGFEPRAAKGADFGARDGMATFAQLELIRCLWSEITRRAYSGEAELDKWLTSKFRVSALRFVRKDTAQKIITALMGWKKRLREQGRKAA